MGEGTPELGTHGVDGEGIATAERLGSGISAGFERHIPNPFLGQLRVHISPAKLLPTAAFGGEGSRQCRAPHPCHISPNS